jgi:hypothetical protein
MQCGILGARFPVAVGLSLCMTLWGAPGCLAPATAEQLLATGFRSPLQTVSSFQTFFRADLPMREYRCLSANFRRENQLSATTYAEGREELLRRQPWIRLLAKAQVSGEEARGADEHWVDLDSLGRTVRVKLVREEFFETYAGEQLLTDGDAEFERLVHVSPEDSGSRVNVQIPLEQPASELGGLSEVVVARQWKIDAFRELTDDDVRLQGP